MEPVVVRQDLGDPRVDPAPGPMGRGEAEEGRAPQGYGFNLGVWVNLQVR